MINTGKTRVRALEPRDEARWRELFDGYIAFYEAQVAPQIITLTFERLLAGEDGMVGLVAVDDSDHAVGLANLVFHRSTWSPTSYCYLEDLYADPSVRGRGVGRALIEATYALADARGATRTYWATQQKNETARRLYDRMGELTDFLQYRRRS
ncbi:MAG: GNAT family N-acetyltransferase [Hyphomicrobiaceae bacterium]|nr:GNAT family N-acetyltransferase [Hyphomicrobiaceae bacterium]